MAATDIPVLAPRERQESGCCAATVDSDVGPAAAAGLAAVAKALGDPTRLRIVDALRTSAPEAICQCELLPLFHMSQPALSKHLRVLLNAGLIGCERRGTWAYYFVLPDATKELSAWLT